ncbi:MAG: hypothetical protein IT162_01850 [Bryobacterales bacterium]|nr:hypothetical protein [Bryobacterales bacterium]
MADRFHEALARALASCDGAQPSPHLAAEFQSASADNLYYRVAAPEAAYSVKLAVKEGALRPSCDCPVGRQGAFCEHGIAAALAWLHPKPPSAEPTLEDAARTLSGQGPEEIARQLLAWAQDDELLADRLLHYAARRSGPEQAVAAAARAFSSAVEIRGFVPYGAARHWARGVREAVGNFAALLREGHAAAVIALCETALGELSRALGRIDDSGGELGSLRDDLQSLHRQACEAARPEPVALARRLFAREMDGGDLDLFSGAAATYAAVLGDAGLSEYRRLAEAEWATVPRRAAGDPDDFRPGRAFRITGIMETLAAASGDIEQQAAVLAHDLASAYQYWRIAALYSEAGLHDRALEWAERGLRDFSSAKPDPRLRAFLTGEYQRRGQHAQALSLVWEDFAANPHLGTYAKLRTHATDAGEWPAWRERALAELRGSIAATPAVKHPSHWQNTLADHTRLVEIFLVEIFLDEGDVEAAWHEAQTGGCSDRNWDELARRRQQTHPAESAAIWLRLLEVSIAHTRDSRYDEPVTLLEQAAAAMQRAGRQGDFLKTVEALRVKYKAKRNFIKRIELRRAKIYLS